MKKDTIIILILLAVALALALAACDDRPRNWKNGLHFNTPSPTPALAFTPDPEVLAFANAVLSQRPWLELGTTNPNEPPGVAARSTFFKSKAEPVIEKEGESEGGRPVWKITFKQ